MNFCVRTLVLLAYCVSQEGMSFNMFKLSFSMLLFALFQRPEEEGMASYHPSLKILSLVVLIASLNGDLLRLLAEGNLMLTFTKEN